MNKHIFLLICFTALAAAMCLAGCMNKAPAVTAESTAATTTETTTEATQTTESTAVTTTETTEETTQEVKEKMLRLKIGDEEVEVSWEDNASVEALKKLCEEKPLVIKMSRYGGFEQVGPIGKDLPSKDVKTKTKSGDIVLYNSSQMVIFYGSNSWDYTRLGHITDKDAKEMKTLLGGKDVTVTVSLV